MAQPFQDLRAEDSTGPGADQPAPAPSALEIHHARKLYTELYALSGEYLEMLNVLNQNYGDPASLQSATASDPGADAPAVDSEENLSENPAPDSGDPDASALDPRTCRTTAYLRYSGGDLLNALAIIQGCVQAQRSMLADYGRALSQDTDNIIERLSKRIEILMNASTFSAESVSSRTVSKGRSILKLSLDARRQAQGMIAEHPEAAIARLRVARFQAIQGLIALETSYEGEQRLKKEFETALMDAEGKVRIQPMNEEKYQSGPSTESEAD